MSSTPDGRVPSAARRTVDEHRQLLVDAIAEASRAVDVRVTLAHEQGNRDAEAFEPLVRHFAAAVRKAGAPPERMVVLLKQCVSDDRLSPTRRHYLDAMFGSFLRWAIDEYYSSVS